MKTYHVSHYLVENVSHHRETRKAYRVDRRPSFLCSEGATCSWNITAWNGWDKPLFYRAWGGNLSDEELKGFMGPGLEIMSPQSPAAKAFLDQFKVMLQEEAYHEQLTRHYPQVKYAQGMKLPQAPPPELVSALWLWQ